MDWTDLLNALHKGGILAVLFSVNYRLGLYIATANARFESIERRLDALSPGKDK